VEKEVSRSGADLSTTVLYCNHETNLFNVLSLTTPLVK